jgi:DNA helicase-2/ATP-dependent DNA helicase PcrA
VVTHRILYLVEELGVHPGRILAMTFTNKAAGEMRRRLREFLGDGVRPLWIGTFHATCARLLRMYHHDAGLSRDFTIIDEEDQLRLLKGILHDHFPAQKGLRPAMLRHRIESAKRSALRWHDLSDKGREGSLVKEVYRLYDAYLKDHHALDFGDLIFRAVEMLRLSEDVRERLNDRFQHVLVDEFQDTDLLQYEFVRLITQKRGNIFVVGDDDQSIYGWRGARVENFLHFKNDYPGCLGVKLEKNYRSTPQILQAAMGVIRCNEERTDKELWTDVAGGENVRYLLCGSDRAEAAAIARAVRDFVDGGGRFGECAVIYRVHAQSRAIEEALIEASVPYRIVGGVRFFERMEVKDLVAYLRLAHNPRDSLSFARVLNVPPRGFGGESLKRVRSVAAERGLSLFEAAGVVVKERLLPGRRLEDLAHFCAMIDDLHRRAAAELPSELLKSVIGQVDYPAYLQSGYAESCDTRMENIRELRGFLDEFEETSDDPDLTLLFDRIALQTNVDAMDEKEDRVTLMTAHSAKGLEFDAVIVAGAENNLFPYRHPSLYDLSPDQHRREIEEDCRLLYVAMTRARSRLLLTAARTRRLFGGMERYVTESPFLEDIPADVLDRRESYYEEELEEAGSVREEAAEAFGGFRIGDSVRHPKWGTGKVVRITPGDRDKITVKFNSGRLKQIVETFLERA